MKTKNTIIHVEFHEGPRKGQNHYFGSITAVFDKIPKKELKTTVQGLYRFKISYENPFKNKVCIIRKGTIHRKPGHRTAPVKIFDFNNGLAEKNWNYTLKVSTKQILSAPIFPER